MMRKVSPPWGVNSPKKRCGSRGRRRTLGVFQVAFVARRLVEQRPGLHHLSAVVGELRAADPAVETDVVEIKAVFGIEQVFLGPSVERLALREIAFVARGGVEFQRVGPHPGAFEQVFFECFCCSHQ